MIVPLEVGTVNVYVWTSKLEESVCLNTPLISLKAFNHRKEHCEPDDVKSSFVADDIQSLRGLQCLVARESTLRLACVLRAGRQECRRNLEEVRL